MKYRYLLLLLMNAVTIAVTAQENRVAEKPIRLKTGVLTPANNLQRESPDGPAMQRVRFRENYYTLIRFSKLPSTEERKQLEKDGIILFDYYPDNAYLAQVPQKVSPASLSTYKVTGVYQLEAKNKIAAKLLQNDQSSSDPDQMIAVYFYGTIDKATAGEELRKVGANIIPTKLQPSHVIFVHASAEIIQKMAALPFVAYISRQTLKPTSLNYNNRATHGFDALSASSGRNLQGQGVTIGIGDDGDPSTHIDFSGRLIQRNPMPPTTHGTHVAGTAGGGGLLNPKNAGMAPRSTLLSQYTTDILVNAPVYINDYNMVLTNNSYNIGDIGCPGDGEYDVLSNFIDDMITSDPIRMHVFAAGNDGNRTCAPFPTPYATIKSGFQCAKNVLTVGELDNNTTFGTTFFGSKGPVNDGRLKPEVVAGGNGVLSTTTNNTYGTDFGTSMASPTVTGAMALLYQRYRQLHLNADPPGALIKAAIVNGADDWGTAGPDFTFGFGRLNARSAVEMIENNNYFSGTVSNGGTATHTIISVPAGADQIKVLLYWADPAAAPNAPNALVNNLDLTVTGTDAVVHRPLILDPTPALPNLANPAVEGVDNKNNIEQVVIYNPPAGNFNITINGSNIPAGPQQYYIVYEVINPSVTVEYPFGNETWVPGENEMIRWSAYGDTTHTFTVEYSLDNGGTWNLLSNNVPATDRQYMWNNIPASPTTQALVRVTRNVSGISDVSDFNFTIINAVAFGLSSPCTGYAYISWPSVPGATSYEVMQLIGDSMKVINATTGNDYLIEGLNKDSTYWFTLRPLIGTTRGRRNIAGSIKPAGTACIPPTFEKDIKLDSLVAPQTGRMFTLSQLASSPPTIRLRNFGSIPTSGNYNISYQVNGGGITTESVSTVVNATSTANVSFTTPFNFAPVGIYTIKLWVDYPGDPLHVDDTLTMVVKQLDNTSLTLNPSFTEGFESATINSYNSRIMGLNGLDRADFSNNNANGRARTFVNTGMAYAGNRAITLDQIKTSGTSSSDSLVTTFNLSNYTMGDQLWLDFFYRNHGTDFNLGGNKVWIRGSETSAWIPVFTLPFNDGVFGTWRPVTPVDITGILTGASQSISSSFQVKFGEQGFASANSVITDGNLDDGYSYDDVKITRSSDDVGAQALINPDLTNVCTLTAAEQISIRVKNYGSTTLNNIQVGYKINNTVVTETIPSLTAGQVLVYDFTQTADLSAFQQYNMKAWVHYATDNYVNNDSLLNIVFNTVPYINTFPYLEGFETSDGSWYTGGLNSSWAWGTPAKTIINRAANGTKAWVTSLTGNYNDYESSYLYSPCFNLSGMTQPVLSFSHIFRTEDNCNCDFHWVDYTLDGITWTKLGSVGSGTNWYDFAALQVWKASDTRWHVSSFNVPGTPAKIRFRIAMSSDPGVNYEGVGIDDVHVFDKAAIYSGPNITSGMTQSVSGSSWIHFNSLAGTRVASINPNGQNLGSTDVRVFINTGGIRNNNNQYYLDRNIVIQPTTAPSGPVSVRFYFLNTEANAVINATGCGTCHKFSDAYLAGVTQYSNSPSEEDGTLTNNLTGAYHFITPSQVDVIPYDNGYYAEYQVSNFSEFWINSGGPTASVPLPQILESFTATKVDASGLLQWVTVQESNMDKFVIEKSTDGISYASIGEVKAAGNSSTSREYQFTDNRLANGMNYYRLKMLDKDGKYTYSPVRKLSSQDTDFSVSIFPNPANTGKVNITASVNFSLVELRDVSGRLIRSVKMQGTQYTLSVAGVSKGTYFVNVFTDGGKSIQKIFVE